MIKIIIVEDEDLMRERLVKTIKWSSIGCKVIGEAQNGRDAVGIIEKEIPDIVITDIKMPEMDGFELCQFICEKFEYIKVIIMTGYDDFSYAQKALRLGVKDYILKPSGKEEILGCVSKVAGMIWVDKNKTDRQERQNKVVYENLTLLKSKIFDDSINGLTYGIGREDDNISNIFGMDNIFVILLIEICSNRQRTENIRFFQDYFAQKLVIEEYSAGSGCDFLVSSSDGDCYIVLSFDSTYLIDQIIEKSKAYAEGLLRYVKEIFDVDMAICISRCCFKIDDLGKIYREARGRLKKESFLSKSVILVLINEKAKENTADSGYPLQEVNNLLELVRYGEKEFLEDNVRNIFNNIVLSRDYSIEYIKDLCIDIALGCANILNEVCKKEEDNIKTVSNIYSSLSRLCNIEEVTDWITDFLLRAIDIVAEKLKPFRKRYITDAFNYISEHYTDDISLTKVADYIHVHPVYLGRILRKELGESFSNLILKIRIDKAMKLLKDPNIKTYEVGYSVGINDPHYFSQVFKKCKGMTPSEYRESLIK